MKTALRIFAFTFLLTGCLEVAGDGTDFEIEEPHPFNRKWMTHKRKRAALKYEVGVSIYSGDIVWLHGPHRGAKHDITIFKEGLQNALEEGEMVEADQRMAAGSL